MNPTNKSRGVGSVSYAKPHLHTGYHYPIKLKVISILCACILLCNCSTMTEYSLKSRSSKFLNCRSQDISISNVISHRTALNGTTMWTASCNGRTVRCTYQEQNAIFMGPGPYHTIPQRQFAHFSRIDGPITHIPLSIDTRCR